MQIIHTEGLLFSGYTRIRFLYFFSPSRWMVGFKYKSSSHRLEYLQLLTIQVKLFAHIIISIGKFIPSSSRAVNRGELCQRSVCTCLTFLRSRTLSKAHPEIDVQFVFIIGSIGKNGRRIRSVMFVFRIDSQY